MWWNIYISFSISKFRIISQICVMWIGKTWSTKLTHCSWCPTVMSIWLEHFIAVVRTPWYHWKAQGHVDGLVQDRRKSIANALELRLSCTNPSMCDNDINVVHRKVCQPFVHLNVVIGKRFPHYWPFEKRIHQSLMESPHKVIVMRSFDRCCSCRCE